MSEDGSIVAVFLLVFGLAFGACAGHTLTANSYEEGAIKNGVAQYHQTTGKWEWIPNPEKVKK